MREFRRRWAAAWRFASLCKNTVFHDLLKLVPWKTFDALVAQHGADDLVRSFTTRHQLIGLLYAQFSGAESLRAIETAMSSHQARLYHLGGKAPARTTFADANRSRSPLVFTGLLEHMLAQADRKVRREMKVSAASVPLPLE